MFIYSIADDDDRFDAECQSADALFRILILDYSKYELKEAVKGVRENRMYTILKANFSDVCADDNGAYTNSRSTKKKYNVNIDRKRNAVTSQVVHNENGYYYYNRRTFQNNYERVRANNEDIWVLERYYRANKSIPGLKRMVVKIKAFDSDLYEPHICVIYTISNEISTPQPVILPHGNSKERTSSRPYIRTSTKTLQKERELLSTNPGKLCQ